MRYLKGASQKRSVYRHQRLEEIPWIKYTRTAQRCDAVVWKKVSLKRLREDRQAEHTRARCKNNAHWQFKSLKRSSVRDGVYCMSHLIYHGIHGDVYEEQRYKRWKAKHDLKTSVEAAHGS